VGASSGLTGAVGVASGESAEVAVTVGVAVGKARAVCVGVGVGSGARERQPLIAATTPAPVSAEMKARRLSRRARVSLS
jgi:hypothetical protein